MSTFTGQGGAADALATRLGAGRLAVGGAMFVAPTALIRVLGVDSASAKRMAFLARMTAARDLGLGVGTLVSRGTPHVGTWLAVSAVADGVDAVVIAAATRRGITRGAAALVTVIGAAGAAAAGGWAAAQVRGRVRARG